MNGNESERKEYRETKPNFDEKSDEIVDLQYCKFLVDLETT